MGPLQTVSLVFLRISSEIQSGIQFYDGITTQEIQEILIRSASDLIDLDHPNYQFVVARLLLFATRKSLYGRMKELPHLVDHINSCVDFLAKVYDYAIYDAYSLEEIQHADKWIDHDRDFLFTYAGLRQVVDKYLVQDRSTGQVYETPQFMYMMIEHSPCSRSTPKQLREWITFTDTTMQSPNTESTFPHLSWRECELHFDSLRPVFLLMLMTPSILSLLLIWRLVDTLHKGRVSVSTQVESWHQRCKIRAERFNTQVWSPSSKSLNQLCDAAHKPSEVGQRLSTFHSGTKKSKTSSS